MKLIIDIPEHDKNVIERFVRGDGCEDFPPSIIENLIRAVYFGTPLDKHDEEVIKETVESIWGKPPCDNAISRQAVLKQIKANYLASEDIISLANGLEDSVKTLPSVYPQIDVLDEIRAEIAENGNSDINAQTVLAIIDKYRKGQTNEDSD